VLDIWPVPILELVSEVIGVERMVESHCGVASSILVSGLWRGGFFASCGFFVDILRSGRKEERRERSKMRREIDETFYRSNFGLPVWIGARSRLESVES